MISVGDAVGALFAGLSASLKPGPVRRKVVRAMCANAAGLLLVMAGLVYAVFGLVDVPGGGNAIGTVVAWAIRLAALVLIFIGAPLMYALVVRLFALVVNQGIFDAARREANAPDPPDDPLPLPTSTAIELRRLGRFVLVSLLLLPVNVIPIAGSAFYALAVMLMASQTMGWDLFAYHFELHGMGYDAQKAWIGENRRLVIIVGAVAMLLCMVPVLQLLTITTNVAGAGILSARMDGAC